MEHRETALPRIQRLYQDLAKAARVIAFLKISHRHLSHPLQSTAKGKERNNTPLAE